MKEWETIGGASIHRSEGQAMYMHAYTRAAAVTTMTTEVVGTREGWRSYSLDSKPEQARAGSQSKLERARVS
jgi:hypothetical protein